VQNYKKPSELRLKKELKVVVARNERKAESCEIWKHGIFQADLHPPFELDKEFVLGNFNYLANMYVIVQSKGNCQPK
jgi:hypothetical protein